MLAGSSRRPVLVVALGNPHRRDDGVGPEVARRLVTRLTGRAQVRTLVGEATQLLDWWEGLDLVVVVDAVRSGAHPGTLHRLEWLDGELPASFLATSTHGLSLAQAVALSTTLQRRPRRWVIYGVEVSELSPGLGLSPPVAAAVAPLADRVVREVVASLAPTAMAGMAGTDA